MGSASMAKLYLACQGETSLYLARTTFIRKPLILLSSVSSSSYSEGPIWESASY